MQSIPSFPRRRPSRRALLLALATAAASGAASAQSACAQLHLASCLEARTSAVTSAAISWSDGSQTYLDAPDTGFQLQTNGSLQYGFRRSLYSGYGLQAWIDNLHGTGSGPAFTANYGIQTSPAGTIVSSYESLHLGQASQDFLTGFGGADPALSFDGRSQTQFGTNRAEASLKGEVLQPYTLSPDNLVAPGLTGVVQSRAVATGQSLWNDSMTLTGTAGTASFDVALDGSLTTNADLIYGLYAVDSNNVSHRIAFTVLLGDTSPGPVATHLTGTLAVDPSLSYVLHGDLYAGVEVPDFNTGLLAGNVAVDANFFDTARVDDIALSPGLFATFGSGPDSALSRALSVSSVPEPGSGAAMLAGGAMLLTWVRRRRQA